MAVKLKADPTHATRVESILRDAGAEHVRARNYGATVIAESGPTDEPVRHFRLRRDTVHLWCLDMAGRGGRWERTPFRANLDELVLQVTEQFPWVLTPIA
jgi:hypothetical protein